MTLTDQIKRAARESGFDAVGISRLEPAPEDLSGTLQARLQEWVRRGYHGVMQWMARDPARRADPRRVLPGCRSIISLGVNYYTDHQPDERPGHGRIARYAWGHDYHDVLRERLEQFQARLAALAPGQTTRGYVDTGPVMEKAWAQRAGLGWIGKHSNLVSVRYGSWLLLAEVLTTLDLLPDEPGADLCGSCTLCIRACPTGAIAEPYLVDATRCISYLTIELRGDGHQIPDELARQMDNRIFGCDDCLDVCPYNVNASPTSDRAFQPAEPALAPNLEEMAALTEAGYIDTFRGRPLTRPKHAGFLRSVCIALGNLTRRHSTALPC